MDEKRFEKLIADLESMTDEQKAQYRDVLGLSKKTIGIRVTGKVQRTDKPLEDKVAKQMQILIDVLPKEIGIDIEEWGALAVAGGLQTQQPPSRIAAYYKKNIVEAGYAQAVA